MVYRWEDAAQVDTAREESQRLRLNVSEQTCVWRISGRLIVRGDFPTFSKLVHLTSDRAHGNVRIKQDGSFSLTAPIADTYRLFVHLDGCNYHYHRGGRGGSWNQASQIAVTDADVRGITFVVPAGACRAGISGKLLDADGGPISGVWVSANTESGHAAGDRTGADGAFDISIADAGRHYLQARINGCWTYFRRGGATHQEQRKTWIRVTDDVIEVRYQLPRGLCSSTISGRLLDANGEPVASAGVGALSDSGNSWIETDANGRFALAVAKAGQYRIRANFDGCHVYYRRASAPSGWRQATQVRVAVDEAVSGITVQLAKGMCELRVSGRLLNADGSPAVNIWAQAGGNNGYGAVHTGPDGAFSFAVPGRGSYRASVWINGCGIYFGSRGPVKSWNVARAITVSNADVSGIELRLPEDPASFCG